MKRLLYIIIFFLLSVSSLIFGQQDRNFWFAAPAVTKNHCNGAPGCNTGDAPVKLIITTFDLPSTVTISQPANDISIYPITGFTPIVLNIAANSTYQLILWSDNFNIIPAENQMRKNVECRPAYGSEAIPLNKGLNISATTDIAVYYIVDEPYNSEIFALKGKNALGTDFYASFQTNKPNHYFNPAVYEPFISSIDIVATDPGITEVVVYPTRPIEGWGTVLPPDSFVVSLQYGQTISLMPKDYWRPSPASQPSVLPANHLTGTRIKTRNGKRIAVTLKDDSVDGDTGCWDLLGDQTIPVVSVRDDGTRKPVIGADYVVMRGNLSVGNRDRAYILATQNGTNVAVTDITLGGPPVNFVLNAGQQATYTLAATTKVVYIKSNNINKPVYVFHVSGAGNGCELGSAILPTISSCTGSFEVGFFRNNEPSADKQFLVNILARDGALDSFLLNGDASIRTVINSAGFTKIPGTPWWAGQFNLTNIIPINAPYILKNTKDIFHLGIMHGGGANGGNYGYFSNYAEVEAGSYVAETGDPGAKICYGETIQLVATGGLTYEWIPSTYLSDPYTDKPFCTPFSSIKYEVVVKGASCVVPDTAEVPVNVADSLAARFDVDITQGCAPLTVRITDRSYGGTKYYWYVDGVLFSSIQNPPSRTFYNNTNAPIDYEIEEEVDNPYCLKVYTRTIRVYPEINAGFQQDTVIGCQPLLIQFTDTSTGNIDTAQYLWDFGDLSQSFDQSPSHIYTNTGNNDYVFAVRLVTTSPYFCRDTAQSFVTVHPRINTAMAISTNESCTPLNISIDPGNSVGVDTFFWHVHSPDADTSYVTTLKAPVSVYHYDSTYASPDTIYINLVGMNRMGCTDTFPQRNVIVFPEVIARFDISNDSICDADSILFTNNSEGYQLFYNWNFDNGTILQDTTDADYTQTFYNRSDADSSYRVTLEATTGYFCESTFDTVIVVHPYIKANFGMDYENNCTPILTTFSNLSIRGHLFDWNFGDDSTSTTANSVFTHQYWNNSATNDTTYFIRLVARNNEGCSDSLMRSLNIFPHVVAAFGQTPSIGCSPLDVSFVNNSSGGILSYIWDFGNGTSSTNPSPIPRTYTNFNSYDTTYYVSLSAINPYGCDSIMNDSVTVFAYVDADFNLPRADSCSPFAIIASNLSSAGAHIYDWDLDGSGFPSNHAFEPVFPIFTNTTLVEDTINVRLIAYSVNDPQHKACADTHTIRVLVYPELDAAFTLNGGYASCQPYISTIVNNTNLPNGNTFQWYIDNTFYSSAGNPPQLNIPNLESVDVPHTVWLYGESNHGCRDTASEYITVYSLVDAQFTINRSGICSADSFQIDRSTSRGGITNYQWNFAGVLDNRTDPVFSYSFQNTTSSTPLVKQIILSVYNSHSCKDTSRRSISVYPEVRANYSLDDNTVCYRHSTSFVNTTANASNYYWDFGDGTGSNDMVPDDHVFENFNNTNDETYTVRLIARSQYNCYDSIQHNLTVYAKPDAEFYFPVTVDCPPFEASMSNESVGFNLTYFWNFGDGGTSTLRDPDHIFRNENSTIQNIPITLIITSGRGCKDTVMRELSVYPDVTVNYTASETIGCSPLTVAFNGTAPNTANLIWYIDGQAFSTLEDPSYRFVNNTPDTRTYEIIFSGHSLYGCSDDTSQNITVYSSPSAEFIPDPRLQDYNTTEDQTTVTFNNETYFQDNWKYFWNFGDGTTDNNNSASFNHIYGFEFWGTAADNYKIPVYMVAWNNEREACRDTVTGEVYIKPPLPQIALEEDVSGCEPFTVDFSATTRYIYDDQLLWDFGVDGATSTEDEPSYTYTENGTYTVKLIVKGDGGTNWDYRIITVNPKPEIDFTFNDSIVFVRSQNKPDEVISFYNHTNYGEYYWWFFEETIEDGATPMVDIANAQSTEKEPTWYYENMGVYNVVLMAGSDQGCLDTMVSPIAIHVLGEGRIQFPTGFFVDPSAPRDENISDPEDPSRNIFRAYGQGVAEFHMEVYNRWGVLIFKSDNINKGWNGFLDGKPAKQDVYLWRAKGRFTNGQPYEMSGDVTLIVAPDIGQVH